MSDPASNDAPTTKKDAPPKRGSAVGVIGFIIALGGGFFIGQWINSRGKGDVELAEGPRYAVELRGDEPTRGPADALVTIIEFADYECPYCEKAAGPLDEIAADYDEDVRVIYKHYPLPGHPKAAPAARAAWAAAQQGKFWEMHAWLFANKAELANLESKVDSLGMDRSKFMTDMTSPAASAALDGDRLAGGKVGVRGTPAFFVNGHRYAGMKSAPQWRAIVEAELEQAEELVDRGTPRANVYATLMSDALQVDDAPKDVAPPPTHDPNKAYRVTTDDRPSLGPADALVTIVVFSDFQCPHCARLAKTMHEVAAAHPDVRIVFRNLPLDMHARAKEAARAALAAARQGKFWEMHDAMFASQRELGSIAFVDLAAKIGLDTAKFEADLVDPEIAAAVDEDETVAAQFGVRGTPAAFVNGRFLGGARGVDDYAALIAEEKARAQQLVDAGTPRAEVYAAVMASAEASAPSAGGAP
jgi:protein-disulfide isomerase